MPRIAELYGDSIYGFCRRLVGANCCADADDLYQQTFLTAMELCRKIETQGNPKSFLMGIAVRIWHNRCRKAARRVSLAPEQDYSEAADASSPITTEEEAQRRIINALVSQLVGALPEKLRVTLIMYYGAQLSVS